MNPLYNNVIVGYRVLQTRRWQTACRVEVVTDPRDVQQLGEGFVVKGHTHTINVPLMVRPRNRNKYDPKECTRQGKR